MRLLLEILGLRTPERGREPVALPSSVRWVVPLVVVSTAAVLVIVGRILGAFVLHLILN